MILKLYNGKCSSIGRALDRGSGCCGFKSHPLRREIILKINKDR